MKPEQRPQSPGGILRPAEALDGVLSKSDVVILCVPLNEETRGLINANKLAVMKEGSYLINVARGPVVVEDDLVAALQSGRLAGAGLDVTEIEPLPVESPLWDLDNVIITPHVGAQSARRVDDSTAFACENLGRFQAGKPLFNVVDKQLGFPIRTGDGSETL